MVESWMTEENKGEEMRSARGVLAERQMKGTNSNLRREEGSKTLLADLHN